MAKTLITELMNADRDKFTERPTKTIKAAHLSKMLGKPVEITIQAIPMDSYMEYAEMSTDKEGNVMLKKALRAETLAVVEGVVDPPLKDKELMEHFGAATPAELAKILFPGGELVNVFNEIVALTGFGADADLEEDTKN